MIDDIMLIFDKNIGRANNLLNIYKNLPKGKGRRSTHKLDILRVTVVMLHSTLEDYFRSILLWKLPETTLHEKLNNIPISGLAPAIKVTLAELSSKHKGKTIQEIINLSVKEYLNTESFNNTTDLSGALSKLNYVVTNEIKDLYPELEKMIKRRHNIVHQADKDDTVDNGRYRVRAINLRQVEKWKTTLDQLVFEINKNFDN